MKKLDLLVFSAFIYVKTFFDSPSTRLQLKKVYPLLDWALRTTGGDHCLAAQRLSQSYYHYYYYYFYSCCDYLPCATVKWQQNVHLAILLQNELQIDFTRLTLLQESKVPSAAQQVVTGRKKKWNYSPLFAATFLTRLQPDCITGLIRGWQKAHLRFSARFAAMFWKTSWKVLLPDLW